MSKCPEEIESNGRIVCDACREKIPAGHPAPKVFRPCDNGIMWHYLHEECYHLLVAVNREIGGRPIVDPCLATTFAEYGQHKALTLLEELREEKVAGKNTIDKFVKIVESF